MENFTQPLSQICIHLQAPQPDVHHDDDHPGSVHDDPRPQAGGARARGQRPLRGVLQGLCRHDLQGEGDQLRDQVGAVIAKYFSVKANHL